MAAIPQDSHPDASALLEQLKQTQLAYQMASEMSQFKAGFLARIVHELRSPLNSMMALHQLILSDLCEDPAEERDLVAQAYKSAQKFLKLLDEILNIAKTEYGTNHLEIQPLQLAEVLAQVYEMTHLLAENRSHRFAIEPPDAEIYVMADPRWLRQVLVNLVDMPLKSMEPINIRISVHPEPTSGYVHILIEEDGSMSTWSEPINLLQSTPEKENPVPSPGLTLLANQTLLELMKGRLEVLEIASPDASSNLTRIQCSVPLVPPDSLSNV